MKSAMSVGIMLQMFVERDLSSFNDVFDDQELFFRAGIECLYDSVDRGRA